MTRRRRIRGSEGRDQELLITHFEGLMGSMGTGTGEDDEPTMRVKGYFSPLQS